MKKILETAQQQGRLKPHTWHLLILVSSKVNEAPKDYPCFVPFFHVKYCAFNFKYSYQHNKKLRSTKENHVICPKNNIINSISNSELLTE